MKQKLTVAMGVVAVAAGIVAATDDAAFRKPLPQDQKILHALSRLTFGPRTGDVEAVRQMGLDKWIDAQLHPDRLTENPDLAGRLAPLTTLNLSASEAADKYQPDLAQVAQAAQALKGADKQLARQQAKQQAKQQGKQGKDKGKQNGPQVLIRELNEAKLYRAIYSERQLEEQLADFWFNHFNVFAGKGADRVLVTSYERDAIRPHVLGKFRDILGATAAHPAMLFYLDNWQNVSPDAAQQKGALLNRLGQRNPERQAKLKAKQQARGLNENYARELLELHTLGVDNGYTQKDIVEVARCFTGWTILQPRQGGEFVYNDRMHDRGEKIVLGVKIPAGGGRSDGERVLDILARRPETAHFLSLKLAQRFVADDPPMALVDRMAKKFLETDGDIRAVTAAMIGSPEFFSEGAWKAKVKTPLELVVSSARAVSAQVRNAAPLAQQIAELGQPLYRKVEPTGYSSAAAEWVNSAALLARMNFALALAANQLPGTRVGPTEFSTDPRAMTQRFMFREPAAQTMATLEKALAAQEREGKARTPELVAGLVLGSPDFQRR